MRRRPTVPKVQPERRLVAILAADIDGNPTRMLDDDPDIQRRVDDELTRLRAALHAASDRVFVFAGTCVMAEFGSAVEALESALRLQADAGRRMAEAVVPIRVRMGLNVGEILVGGSHVGGAAINLAAQLEQLAPPGGIAMPATVYDQVCHAVQVPVSLLDQPSPAEPFVVVGVTAAACLAWSQGPTRRPAMTSPPADPRIRLAIVPFRGDAHTASFANAATDEVIRILGGLPTWLAVARVPTAALRAPIDLLRLRQTYDARYVLHGTVEQERRLFRLAVELNEADTGRVLWSDRFDREIAEIGTFRDQAGRDQAGRDEAGLRIATSVTPLLTQRDLHRSGLSRPETLAAHDLALRAYGATLQPRPATFAAASGWLREALDRAPPHASTYFAIVAWHLMALDQGWAVQSWAADAQRDDWVAGTVVDNLDRNDPASMALLGYLHSSQHRDHALACAMLDRVIDTAPCCSVAWSLKSLVLSQLGEGEAAIFAAERAETMPALGPDRAWRSQVTAMAYYVGGRYADAAGWARVSTMHHPGLAINARVLAASLAVLGRLDEAQQAANLVLEIDPGFRIGAWRRRAHFTAECRERYAQRLRLAGLPE